MKARTLDAKIINEASHLRRWIVSCFVVIITTISPSPNVLAMGGSKNVGNVSINSFAIYNGDTTSEFDIALTFTQSNASDRIKSWELTVGSQSICDDTEIGSTNSTFTFNPTTTIELESGNTTWADIMTQPAGTYSVTVEIFSKSRCRDEDQDSETASLPITYDPNPGSNDSPVGSDDAANTTVNTTLTSSASVLANDTDPEGDNLAVTAGTFSTSQSGSIVLQSNGNYSYTPASNFTGFDTYTYTLSDGSLTDTATITFTVTGSGQSVLVSVSQDSSDTSSPYSANLTWTRTGSYGKHTHKTEVFLSSNGGSSYSSESGEWGGQDTRGYHEDSGTGVVTLTPSDISLLSLAAGSYQLYVKIYEKDNRPVQATSNVYSFTIVNPNGNNAPVAVNDTASTNEDTALTSSADLVANDTDADGDSLSVTAGTFPTSQSGSLVLAADGSYTYTPAANFSGTDTVDYTLNDGTATDTGTLTITVNAVNDAPVAVNDTASTNEDTALTSSADLVANDTDADGDSLSVTAGTFPTSQSGSLVLAADGSYTYTPAANFSGTDTVDYTLNDGTATDTGTLTITVNAVNDAPVAVNDTASTNEDTALTSSADLVANDTDADGDSLSVTAGTFPTSQSGSLVLAADGSYTYTPAANFSGTDTVDYTLNDGTATDTGTLTITVNAVNDAPVAVNDTASTNEDTALTSSADLVANDTDADGDSLSVTAGTFPTSQSGSLVLAADGSYTYTPAANFSGTDTVDYTLNDGTATDTGTLTITVNAVNDAPVAVNDTASTNEDTALTSSADLVANDTDADGDSLSVTAGTFPTSQSGSLVLAADGSYTYTPAANFSGTDTVDYTLNDGTATDTGTLTITVNAVNDAPVAVNDTASTNEDTALTSSADLVANDTDADGDSLSVTAGTFTTSQSGSLVLAADGSYTYTPAANFSGTDTVDYTLTDGTATDTGTLTITVNAVNDAPVAVNDTASTNEDTALTSSADLVANDTDADGDSLSVTAGTFTTSQSGSLVLAADGSYTYTPAANFSGTDTVDYTLTDGTATDTGTLTITVNAVNDAPVAVNDTASTNEDTALTSSADLVANDTDADGDSLSVTAGTFTTSQSGSLVLAADGSYTYTPAANFSGTDTVDYTLTDGTATDTGTLTITVNAVNDAPVAVNDTASTNEDTALTSSADLVANDTDADGDSLSVTAGTFTTSQSGSLVLAADGSYTYTPAANFSGTDTVDYTLTDGTATDTGTLTITVNAVNDAPVAVNDTASTNEDTALTSSADLVANDTDADGDSLSVTAGTFTTSQSGSLVLAADGSYTYTPAANFSGTDTVDYTLTDGTATDTGTLTITVNAVNDAPVAVNDTASTNEDTALTSSADLVANDTDADGDSLSVTAGTFTTSQSGSLVLAADGSYTYTPAANFSGTDTVDYTLTDGTATDTGTLTITVNAVNDAPVAVNDTASTNEDTALTSSADLVANDTDADGDSLSVTAGTFTTSQSGSLVLAADGSYTYTPAANFSGTDTVDYTLTDGTATDTGTLTITVNAVNDAPVITGSLAVTIDEGTRYTLTSNDLFYTDVDDDNAGVTFTVSQQSNGATQLNNNATLSFTGAQLAAGEVSFLHNGSETTSAGFTIQVEDGNEDVSTPATSSFNFTITSVNDAPVITGDLTATMDETASYTLTTTDLFYTDTDDDDAGVNFTASSENNGAITVSGIAAPTFTGTQLAAGDVAFLHDGSETTSARFTITVEDGNEESSTPAASTFNITVNPVNDAPAITGDLTATITEGLSYVIQTADLFYTDDDDNNPGVTFTVSALTNGTIEVNGSVSSTFSVNRLNGNKVIFIHDGSETINASFLVQVEDGDEDNSAPMGTTFNFTVTPVNDPPILTGDLAANLDEGTAYTLTTTDVFYTDADDGNSEVTFTTGSLTNGSVTVSGSSVNTFTGSELASGDVIFLHDGSETTAASFTVSVEDGNEDSSTAVDSVFSLTVNAVNDKPVISGAGNPPLDYTLGNVATQIDSTLSISDDDDTEIVSATITISSAFASGEDLLSLVNPPSGFTGTWNSSAGTLTINRTDSLANYAAALSSVYFYNSNGASMNTSTRTITWVVNDGETDSVAVTSTIRVNPPPIDHYAILIEGSTADYSGYTCKALRVTVVAHDISHQSVDLKDYNVSLGVSSSSGSYSSSQLSFSGTSSVSSYLQPGAGTYTVILTSSSHSVDPSENPTISIATDNPSISFSIDNPPFTSGGTQDGAGGSPEAITMTVNSVSACQATPDSSQALFSFSCTDPGSCVAGQVFEVNNTSIAESTTPQTAVTVFSGSTASLQVGYSDVGQVTLRASAIITPDNSASFIVSGSTTLTSLPDDIVITSLVDASDANNVNPLGSAGFLPAGEDFTLTAQSLNSDGNLTPNFTASAGLNLNSVAYPLTNPTNGTFGNSVMTFSSGQATHTTDYSEVGAINANVTSSYFGESFASSSLTIGRFYPADFELSGGQSGINMIDGCSVFTYFGEPVLSASYTLTAKNADGDTTINYDPNKGYSTPIPSLIGYAASYGAGSRNISSRITTGTGSGSWSNGVYTYSATDASLARQPSGAPENPLLVDFGVQISDGDFSTFPTQNFSAGEGAACTTCTAVALSGRPEFYYGRLAISSATAPDDQALPVPLILERYNNNSFSLNGVDSCTTVNRTRVKFNNSSINLDANRSVLVNSLNTTGSFTNPYITPTVINNLLTSTQLFFSQGTSGLSFSAPCSQSDGSGACNGTGSFTIGVDLSDLPWLKYDWDQDGSFLESPPTATGSFGGYRGHDKIINWREVAPGSD